MRKKRILVFMLLLGMLGLSLPILTRAAEYFTQEIVIIEGPTIEVVSENQE